MNVADDVAAETYECNRVNNRKQFFGVVGDSSLTWVSGTPNIYVPCLCEQ